MTSRTHKVIYGVLTGFLQYGSNITFQLLTAPLILRLAGVETLGAFSTLNQAISYLGLIDLGFGGAVSWFLAYAYGRQDEGKMFQEVLATSRTVILLTNTCFAIILVITVNPICALLSLHGELAHQAKLCLYSLAAWSVIRTPLAAYGAALVATQRLALANIFSMVTNAIRLAATIVFAFLHYGLLGLFAANILAQAVAESLETIYFCRMLPMKVGWGIKGARRLYEMAVYSIKNLSLNLAYVLTFYTDSIIVSHLFGVGVAAAYFTTYAPAQAGWQIVFRINRNIVPAISELFARGAMERIRTSYVRALRYNLLLAVVLTSGLLLFNRVVVEVWVGRGLYLGTVMTIALAAYALFGVMGNLNAAYFLGCGEIGLLSRMALLESLLNVSMSFVLGRALGPSGVAVATAATTLAFMPYGLYRMFRLLDLDIRKVFSQAIVPSLRVTVGIVATCLLFQLLPPAKRMVTVVMILPFSIIAATIVFYLGLTMEERHEVVSRLTRVTFRSHPNVRVTAA